MKKLFILILLFNPLTVLSSEVEIGGLLLDNTRSRQGHEFFTSFSQLWQDVPNTNGHVVVIKEIVIPRSGTRLTVTLNNKNIFVTHLGRRQSPIKDRVEQAVLILIEAMAQSQLSQSNPDLATNGW
ncbi:curli production assembly/transport protein CsgE [Pseudoalteromonas sp. C2R02]|uniref:curli production assembly/transport protein CsgE n=1 Tax=Pseudoalteromonas sp. C2R02 TaxID=2841565 RepID=UPI001C0973EB|nr:curli production assembly/transport protein CsgE [Pseudoalteromonas sp. C2R02]MBU2972689.1 curli production assembly/transport protein CsgE [Pseudoalteromonas sp. C2R02]